MYPEGSFMRAFDYSAWLWCKYIKDFKAIRRKIKDSDETVVQIGCPLSSLSKIADSYSCIKGRGTHYGINRLESFIRKESLNYTEKVYILKMDISGYFMNINREKLLER
jgi:hypothetical protein